MSSDLEITAQCWSEHTARFSGRDPGLFWWEVPEIHKHINRKISGISDVDWVAYTLGKYFPGRLPLTRCLSLGCGTGDLERSLARLAAFQHCDAYDIAEGSVQEARRLAQAETIDNINYSVADVDTMTLPPGFYDSVWIHSAMHHFQELEHVCQQIKRALNPEGLLILNEYVGPSRFRFPARQKEVANLCLQLLPARYRIAVPESIAIELERTPLKKGTRWFISRLMDKLRDGDLRGAIQRRSRVYKARISGQRIEKRVITFPSWRDVIAADPSEAVRSEEILTVLQRDFEIIEKKGWGGNVLQFLLAGIAGNFSDDDPHSQTLLRMLINVEDTLIQCGEFESDCAYIVARPLAT